MFSVHPHARCLAPSLELGSESDFKADETDSGALCQQALKLRLGLEH